MLDQWAAVNIIGALGKSFRGGQRDGWRRGGGMIEERKKGKQRALGFPVREISMSVNEAESAHQAVN